MRSEMTNLDNLVTARHKVIVELNSNRTLTRLSYEFSQRSRVPFVMTTLTAHPLPFATLTPAVAAAQSPGALAAAPAAPLTSSVSPDGAPLLRTATLMESAQASSFATTIRTAPTRGGPRAIPQRTAAEVLTTAHCKPERAPLPLTACLWVALTTA